MTAGTNGQETVLDDPRIDHALLSTHGFDRSAFLRDQARIRQGTLCPETSRITGTIEPVTDVVPYALRGPRARQMRDTGARALADGAVAVVVLNGGMATRFGGGVKSVVEVYEGRSFLALKADDVLRARKTFGAPIPLVLMNSFNTHDVAMAHLTRHDRFGLEPDEVHAFQQSISVRLNRDGSLFIGTDQRPSYHAPGHGDLFASLKRSGTLEHLVRRGIRYLLVSNVDNLGATVDPVVLGHHIVSETSMTVEVTQKRKTASGQWDKGGAPARVDRRVQIVEGFRFPPAFAQESLPDFSTNNMVFTATDLAQDIPLPRHMVRKAVDGCPAYQLETVTGEASGLYAEGRPILPLQLLRVPRDRLPIGRFYPIKEKADLERSSDLLKRRLEAGWAARET